LLTNWCVATPDNHLATLKMFWGGIKQKKKKREPGGGGRDRGEFVSKQMEGGGGVEEVERSVWPPQNVQGYPDTQEAPNSRQLGCQKAGSKGKSREGGSRKRIEKGGEED